MTTIITEDEAQKIILDRGSSVEFLQGMEIPFHAFFLRKVDSEVERDRLLKLKLIELASQYALTGRDQTLSEMFSVIDALRGDRLIFTDWVLDSE